MAVTIRKVLMWLVLLLVVAFAAIVLLLRTDHFEYSYRVVHTGSMGSALPSGSLAIIHRHQYEVGQPVTFKVHGQDVTHRLIAINADGTITTKGDANDSVDPWNPPTSNIVGGVVQIWHNGGLVVFWLPFVAADLLILALCYLLWPSDEDSAGGTTSRQHAKTNPSPAT